MSKKISQLARLAVTDGLGIAPVAKNGLNYSQAVGGLVLVTAFAGVTLDGVTDDTVGVTAAVAAAFAGGYDLYWPDGTALTTASIPLLHSVRHRGPGVIKRGAGLFCVEPANNQANALYVATTGSAAADGLSATEPMRGFQNAITALKNYGPVLEGTWTVNFAAGTGGTDLVDYGPTVVGLRSRNPITFAGPAVGGYPNVPTFIVNRTGGSTQGWAFTRFMNVVVQDIKFTNFATGQAVLCSFLSKLQCTNLHSFGNLYDVYVTDESDLTFVSGILDGNNISASSNGIATIVCCGHQIGTTGGSAGDVVIKNHGVGAATYESCSGHCNATIQDCVYGARCDSAARFNFDTTNFKRNTTAAVRLGANAQAYGLETCVFNTGAADANTRNVIVGGGAMDASQDENTTTPRVYQCTQNQVTRTGDTAETAMWSELCFPARRFPHSFNVSKLLEMLFFGTLTGTAGTKTIRFRLDTVANSLAGTVIATAVIAAASAADYKVELNCSFGLNAQRSYIDISQNGVLPVTDYNAFSVVMNNGSDWYLTVTVQLGNAADSLVMNTRELRIAG